MFTPRGLLHVLALSGLAMSLAADVLHLNSGGRLEGDVTVEGDDYRVTTAGGVITVRKSDVASIERKPGPRAEYAAKRAELDALAAKTPPPADLGAAERKLGLWCRERGLRAEAAQHLAAADKRLGGDLDCAKGLTELGWVRWEDRWVPKAEAMAKLGYVQKNGTWIRREEAEADAQQQADEASVRRHLRDVASPDRDRRHRAVGAIHDLPREHKLKPLEDALADSSPGIRAFAATHLGELRDGRAFTALAGLALTDRDDDARHAAVGAVQAILGPQAIRAFLPGLAFADPVRRLNAERALAQIGDSRAAQGVLERYLKLLGTEKLPPPGGGTAGVFGLSTPYEGDADPKGGVFGDPVVMPMESGVSLGVGGGANAQPVEEERRLLVIVLEKLTGNRFGDNAMAWIEWWKREKGK